MGLQHGLCGYSIQARCDSAISIDLPVTVALCNATIPAKRERQRRALKLTRQRLKAAFRERKRKEKKKELIRVHSGKIER